MKISTNPVRGCKEYLPNEMCVRDKVISIIKRTYANNGFNLIKTPILESLEWLTNGDEGENTKLMFKTIKRGAELDLTRTNLTEKDITAEGLKYDQTVPLVRFWCNNREKLTFPFKSIQIDESFRAERPQKGRLRQFTQCDADIIGDGSVNADIDIISTALQAYYNVGLRNVEARISDRRILNAIIDYVGFEKSDQVDIAISLDKFDKIAREGVTNELIEKGYDITKVKKLLDIIIATKTDGVIALNGKIDAELIHNAQLIVDTINQIAPDTMTARFDITIVRGQGYYTGTVFEFYATAYGFNSAIGGGGRYDNMSQKFIGEPVPMVGFGLGLEPTIMLVTEHNLLISAEKKLALLYSLDNTSKDVFKYKTELQKEYDVAIFLKQKNVRAQLDRLMQNGYVGFVDINKKEIVMFEK